MFLPKSIIFSFIFDRGSPLVPKQGRESFSVSQHDLIFLKVRIRPRTMAQVVEHAFFLPKTLLFSFIFDRGSPLVPKHGREGSSVSQHGVTSLNAHASAF